MPSPGVKSVPESMSAMPPSPRSRIAARAWAFVSPAGHLPADDAGEDEVGGVAEDLRPDHRQADAEHHGDEHHDSVARSGLSCASSRLLDPLKSIECWSGPRPGHHPPHGPGHQAASASVSWESTISR